MGWGYTRKAIGGILEGESFPGALGDPEGLVVWATAPTAALNSYGHPAPFQATSTDNRWIPDGAIIEKSTLLALTEGTYHDIAVFQCDESTKIVLKVQRSGTIIMIRIAKRILSGETETDTVTTVSPQNINLADNVPAHTTVSVLKVFFGNFTYGSTNYFSIGISGLRLYEYSGTSFYYGFLSGLAASTSNFWEGWMLTDEPQGEETSPEFGPASKDGGGYMDGSGSFDDSSDTITLQNKPSIGVTSVGFINVYKIEPDDLAQLGSKLFPSISQIVFGVDDPTIQDVMMLIAQILMGANLTGGALPITERGIGMIDVLLNGKLIDYVIDCHVIPCSISGATVEALRVGYRSFDDIQLARATEDYVDVDCGSLQIPEYWGNFLDYSTTTELYLPFVGYVPIDCEMYIGGTLRVMYRVNIVDGSFLCCVYATSSKSKLSNSLIGQYQGVCCVHYPITGLQYASVVGGLISTTAGAVTAAAGGNVPGAVSSALQLLQLHPDNPMSNGYNASGNFLAKRKPYLVIKRPAAQFSTKYNLEEGLPLNVAKNLSDVSGFTVVDASRITVSGASAEELAEIKSLLEKGVIL